MVPTATADQVLLPLLVAPSEPMVAADLDRALETLNELRGWARSEVAATLQRKRAPDLRFVLVPSEGWEGES